MPMTGDTVISFFKRMDLGRVKRREEILQEATEAAKLIINALQENSITEDAKAQIKELIYKGHRQRKRIALMAMFELNTQLGKLNCKNKETLFKLNKVFGGECIDAIISLLDVDDDSNKKMENISPEDYKAEFMSLHKEIDRANRVIANLQNDFEEELEESKVQEKIAFLTKLNSHQYGCILDMLVSAKKGLKKLRREKISLPIEISSVPVLIMKLSQFLDDCGIDEIIDVGEELDITSSDLSVYDYDGSPFKDDDDVKHVVVVSSGWQIYEQDIVISNPKVKEKEN
jgi:hypothetical protein